MIDIVLKGLEVGMSKQQLMEFVYLRQSSLILDGHVHFVHVGVSRRIFTSFTRRYLTPNQQIFKVQAVSGNEKLFIEERC